MTEHNISMDTKYFEPVQNGQITLLIFDKKVIQDFSNGDEILLSHQGYQVKKKIAHTKIKSFDELSENDAKKAGFLNKDFLKDEIRHRFNIDSLNYLLNGMDDILLFCIYLETPLNSQTVIVKQKDKCEKKCPWEKERIWRYPWPYPWTVTSYTAKDTAKKFYGDDKQ